MSDVFRTLRVTPDGLVKLLKAVSVGQGVAIATEGIPEGAAIAGVIWNDTDRVLELELVYGPRWPNDATGPIEFKYARRYRTDGNSSDWGQPLPIGPIDA